MSVWNDLQRLRTAQRDTLDEVGSALSQAQQLAEATAADAEASEVTRWQARMWLDRFAQPEASA